MLTPEHGRRLRATVVAIWLTALTVFARLPLGPPPLGGICLPNTASDRVAVGIVAGVIAAVVAYRLARLPHRLART